MLRWTTRTALLAAGATVAATALAGAPADAAVTTVNQVRQADLTPATSGVNAGGKLDFLAQGVHLSVPDPANDFARGHFAVDRLPLSQVHAIDYTWFGTDNKPGVYYDIDIDGDGSADGELVGESFYGPTDLWLNRDVQDMPGTHTQPNGTFAGLAPCDIGVQRAGAIDTCSPPNGVGADFHGTIDDWNRRISAAGKTATIVGGGFVASGIKQDGVLTQITYGPEQFVFTNQAKTTPTVTIAANRTSVVGGHKVKVSGTVKTAGGGAKVSLQVKKAGVWTTVSTKTLAATGDYKFRPKTPTQGRFKARVEISETNSTAKVDSKTVKVVLIRK